MKKSKTEFFYPILTTIIAIIFCTFAWDYILLPYSNPHEIVGAYSDQNYSVYNDTIRYSLFTILPVAVFFLFF